MWSFAPLGILSTGDLVPVVARGNNKELFTDNENMVMKTWKSTYHSVLIEPARSQFTIRDYESSFNSHLLPPSQLHVSLLSSFGCPVKEIKVIGEETPLNVTFKTDRTGPR